MVSVGAVVGRVIADCLAQVACRYREEITSRIESRVTHGGARAQREERKSSLLMKIVSYHIAA